VETRRDFGSLRDAACGPFSLRIVADCPLIPGCISQGKDQREALANIRETIELCMETQPHESWSLPPDYQVIDIDVAA
jgi:predicted RNase H-like HicB family nuclease